MARIRKRISARRSGERNHVFASAWALDATSFSWDNRWGMPLEAAAVGAFAGDNVMRAPTAPIFQQARRWWRLHRFIQTICQLRIMFANFGLLGRIEMPVDTKNPEGEKKLVIHPGIRAVDSAKQPAIDKWKIQQADEIQRVTTDIWRERSITRNVIAFWRKGGRLLVRFPEQCEYTDEFGWERLTIKYKLSDEQISELKGITEKLRKLLRNSSGNLVLDHDNADFSFRVLKDEAVGMGLGWPDLATLFHACSLEESLLVGDRQLADACRSVYEQHQLGHEIKGGLRAGQPTNFINKAWATAVKNEVKSKKGHIQMATRHDHKILIGAGRPDPKQFDVARYKEIADQMAVWGMPYAQMMQGVINPFLMTLARQQAAYERERMGPFLAEIYREALRAPAEIYCRWEDSCFWDSRLLLDVLKTGVGMGPLSQAAFIRGAGYDVATMRQEKSEEGELSDKIVEPAFDAAHGNRDPMGKPGKPAGKKDKS